MGFNCLQELVLDSNDLVQLDQWRSLDCLPKLRVLGLAANRIRRLKSEASEQAMAVGGGEQERRTFFETLEEMDLRSNDFVSLDALGLLHELPSLKKILVSISVSDKQKNSAPFRIQTQRQEAFYMAGNGSHMAQRKKQHRKSERSKRNYFMRVSSKRPDHLPSLRQTMGKFSEMSDEELQRVLFAEGFGELRGAGPEDFEEPPVDSPYKLPALDLINEHLSDADMDAMFKQRRAQIDDLVRDKCAQEPTRQFLKPIPFSLSDQMVRIIQQHSTDDGEGAGKAFLTQQDGRQYAVFGAAGRRGKEFLQKSIYPCRVRENSSAFPGSRCGHDDVVMIFLSFRDRHSNSNPSFCFPILTPQATWRIFSTGSRKKSWCRRPARPPKSNSKSSRRSRKIKPSRRSQLRVAYRRSMCRSTSSARSRRCGKPWTAVAPIISGVRGRRAAVSGRRAAFSGGWRIRGWINKVQCVSCVSAVSCVSVLVSGLRLIASQKICVTMRLGFGFVIMLLLGATKLLSLEGFAGGGVNENVERFWAIAVWNSRFRFVVRMPQKR